MSKCRLERRRYKDESRSFAALRMTSCCWISQCSARFADSLTQGLPTVTSGARYALRSFCKDSPQNNPIASAFNPLSQDLQSGNPSAAQQQDTTIEQDFQNSAASQGANADIAAGHGEGFHHMPRGDSNTN
jgi:hypothetical protein